MTALKIDLRDGCGPACAEIAGELHATLTEGWYTYPCSILRLPKTREEFADYLSQHRTMRKRDLRAARRGYTFSLILREQHVPAVYEINRSLPERQGRPMNASYNDWPVNYESPLPEYECQRHRVRTYGVFLEETLCAYASIYRVGELVNVSTILGHGEHLRNEVMYALLLGVIQEEGPGGGYMLYSRHDSGTEGLKWFKERFGFAAERVEWCLS